MPTEIKVPSLGESVAEATVAKWLKRPGELVALDEPVVDLETDKITLEVNAPVTGRLADILAEEGTSVPVGALLGRIDEVAAGSLRPAPHPAPLPASGAAGSSPRPSSRKRGESPPRT